MVRVWNLAELKRPLSGFLLLPELSTATTAALSHLTSMLSIDHSGSQIAVMGTSSLTEMWVFFKFPAHSSWNHLSQKNAPHPQLPEASDTSNPEQAPLAYDNHCLAIPLLCKLKPPL